MCVLICIPESRERILLNRQMKCPDKYTFAALPLRKPLDHFCRIPSEDDCERDSPAFFTVFYCSLLFQNPFTILYHSLLFHHKDEFCQGERFRRPGRGNQTSSGATQRNVLCQHCLANHTWNIPEMVEYGNLDFIRASAGPAASA